MDAIGAVGTATGRIAFPIPPPISPPISLWANAQAQAAWYFARYGAQSIVVLYIAHQVLTRPSADIRGLGAVEYWLGLTGASPLAVAPALMGAAAMLEIPAQILAGLLGDATGRARAACIGLALMTLGSLLLCRDATALLAILCDVAGGALAINLFGAMGDLYDADDPRRAGAFRTTALVQDVATVAGPLACGGLAARFGYHAGFLLAAGVLAVGTASLRGAFAGGFASWRGPRPHIAPPPVARPIPAPSGMMRRLPLLACLLPVLGLASLGNEQIYDAYPLWAERHADLHFLGHAMPPGWLLSVDAGVSIVMQVVVNIVLRRRARSGAIASELGQVARFAWIGAAAPLILALASWRVGPSGRVDPGWLLGFHIMNDTAMAVVVPVGMALFAHGAPPALRGTVMALYVVGDRLADVMAGRLGAALPALGSTRFWLAHAGLVALGAGLLSLAAWWRERRNRGLMPGRAISAPEP